MFNIGTGEMVLICVVALLVLGPKRLPETARSIGRFFRNLRRQTDSVRNLVQREFLSMDLEENNNAALKSMASPQPAENPPLSPAPTFPVVKPAAAMPHTPPALAAPQEVDPYHLASPKPSPFRPSAEESALRDAELDSLFDTWLENKPALPSAKPPSEAPEASLPEKALLAEQEGKKP